MVGWRRGLALFGVVLGLSGCAAQMEVPDAVTSVVAVGSGGAGRNLLFVMPRAKVRGVVVMFPGGDGAIGLRGDGSVQNGGNFLIRTRARWVAAGFLYVAVDGAADEGRVGAVNRQVVAEAVRAVRQRSDAPIWLVGTSAGAPAALDGAAGLAEGVVAGVVVSSPVTVAGPRETVFDAELGRISGPVLIQVHRNDGCGITPPGQAGAVKAALVRARVVEVQEFAGGAAPRSRPCQAFSAHGFTGIEDEVVGAAVGWMGAH